MDSERDAVEGQETIHIFIFLYVLKISLPINGLKNRRKSRSSYVLNKLFKRERTKEDFSFS